MLLLVALGQLGYDEVAQALGISPGTVGSRLTRARKKLVAPPLSRTARRKVSRMVFMRESFGLRQQTLPLPKCFKAKCE